MLGSRKLLAQHLTTVTYLFDRTVTLSQSHHTQLRIASMQIRNQGLQKQEQEHLAT